MQETLIRLQIYEMSKFLLILCICCHLALSASAPRCSDIDELDDAQLWKLIRPNKFQIYFTVVAGSISVILLILTLWTWRIYRSFSVPSDIMFAICWAELFQNTSLVASSIYFLMHEELTVPPNFSAACTSISIFFTLGNTASLVYNVVFCVVLSLSIKKTLKGSLFSQVRYHTFVLIAVVAITISLAVSQVLGTGLNGICGYKIQNRQSFARFIIQIIVVIVCFFSMYMFHTKIPRNSYFKKVSVFGFYYYYMGFFAIIQLLSTVGYLIGNIACRTGASYSSDIIQISITFGSCQSILLSFVLIFLRFSHPLLKIKVKKLFTREMYSHQLNPQQQPWLGSLLQSIKGSQIISFITGILVTFTEHEYKIQKFASISKFSFNKNYVVKLNEAVTDEYILRRINNRESLIVQQKLDGLRSLQYKVTVFAAQVFAELLSHQKDVNVFHSFNINLNLNLVKQQSYTNGGKSGQFFFGTHDHKFLMKTITIDEAELYLQKIKDFYQYFLSNPKSLIAKILGLFKFERSDINEEPVYIILMRNVSPHDKKFQQRVYDIKGSQFNRSTIDEKKIQSPEKLRNHTLKDQDFKKLEGKICIQPEYSQRLRSQLRKDAQFLGKMEVMDYSVLIVKRRGAMRGEDDSPQKHRFNEIPSYAEKDLYYNIGIIDYLQSWTLKRKAERAFKSMITKKKVTVTSPQEYSSRLSQFIDKII